MSIPNMHNVQLAVSLARAANDWTLDRWLGDTEARFYGLILAPNLMPEESATEIRRAGKHDRFVGVLMAGNGLGKRYGHPLYMPIYRAAAEMNLPVVIHIGGDASPDTLTHQVPGGFAMTYGEYTALAPLGLQAHLLSLIGGGVFNELPGLRFLVVGGGVTWYPGFMWRVDHEWRSLRREVPWLTQPPSEYFRTHFKVATYQLEQAATTDQIERALNTFGSASDLLCYAGGYPYVDMARVDEVAQKLPPQWLPQVMFDNAKALFRWPKGAFRNTTSPAAALAQQ
jgi:predicted TIM-barrel fold metal-dependent hydrolase